MAKTKEKSLSEILNKYSAETEVELTPTGILPLDEVLGGGLATGGMYCSWGPAGSFKSTVAIQVAKSYCKRGEKVVFIDTEKAFNKQQQESFGVRKYVEDGTLIHLTADNYAQIDEITSALAENPEGVKLVVVDSETQLLPLMNGEVDVTSNQPGLKSKQGSVWLTKTKSSFYHAGITSLILSHARSNLNMTSIYGPTTKMAGGYANQHIPDAIIQFLPGTKFGADKQSPEGVIVHISTDKNKFAPPFRRVDARCYYGVGIKKSAYLVDWALENNVITKAGSFFQVNGESVRGTEALFNLNTVQLNWLLDQYNLSHSINS